MGRIKWPQLALSTEPPNGLHHPHYRPFHPTLLSLQPLLMANHNLTMGVSIPPQHTHTHHFSPLFDPIVRVVCGFPLWRSSGQHHQPQQSDTISLTWPECSLIPMPQTRMWSRGETTAHHTSLAVMDPDAMDTEEMEL